MDVVAEEGRGNTFQNNKKIKAKGYGTEDVNVYRPMARWRSVGSN